MMHLTRHITQALSSLPPQQQSVLTVPDSLVLSLLQFVATAVFFSPSRLFGYLCFIRVSGSIVWVS